MIPIYTHKPDYIDHKEEYQTAINNVLNAGNFINGIQIKELEQQLANYVGVKHSICCSSGTDALLMSLMALGIKTGDEVITTPFTWISTAEVISLLGAKPVFVDIDPQTYNMNPQLLRNAITDKTRAILPVNMYGHIANLEEINDIANSYNNEIAVIEDAAQSFGAEFQGQKSGGITTIGCTSFFPSKPLGCYGDGGACFTNDDQLAENLRAIRNHGGLKRFHHTLIGLNGRLDTIQAAVLQVKLKYFPESLERRQAIARRYLEQLKINGLPVELSGYKHAFGVFTLRCSDRNKLKEQLLEDGISTAVYYPMCLHLQEAFAYLGYKKGDFPVSEKTCNEVISLPCYPELSEEDQQKIIESVNQRHQTYQK